MGSTMEHLPLIQGMTAGLALWTHLKGEECGEPNVTVHVVTQCWVL